MSAINLTKRYGPPIALHIIIWAAGSVIAFKIMTSVLFLDPILAISLIVSFYIFLFVQRGTRPYLRFNFFKAQRQYRVSELFSLAYENIIIYSGHLDRAVFASPEVLKALRELPESCTISVFIDEPEIDLGSSEVKAFLGSDSDRINVYYCENPIYHRHFMIVDERHIRVEFTGRLWAGSNGQASQRHGRPKFALYAFDVEKLAARFSMLVRKRLVSEHSIVKVNLKKSRITSEA